MRLGSTALSVTQPGRRRRPAAAGGVGGGLSLPARTFTFKYHIYGSAFAGLYLYWFRTYPSTQLNAFWYTSSQTHTSSTDPWLTKTIDMSGRAGEQGKFVFTILRGPGTQQDAALDEIKWVDGTGTVNDFSGDTAAGRNLWRHFPGNYTTSTGSAYASTTYTLGNAVNGQWSYDTGGGTATWGTGPSSAADGDPNKDYIYFEGSYGTQGYWTPMKMTSTLTI
jgi:hypothetical protein